MIQMREFQARTDSGRLVLVIEQREPHAHSHGVRPRPRYL